jgi:hypothetical protein
MTQSQWEAELGALAVGAAAAVAAAMATDGWEAVRRRIAAWFRLLSHSRAQSAMRQLEQHDSQDRAAADPHSARPVLRGARTPESAEPSCGAGDSAEPPRTLASEYSADLAPVQRSRYRQVNIATDYARTFAVQNGNLRVHSGHDRAAETEPSRPAARAGSTTPAGPQAHCPDPEVPDAH